jgi:hypothetical protein
MHPSSISTQATVPRPNPWADTGSAAVPPRLLTMQDGVLPDHFRAFMMHTRGAPCNAVVISASTSGEPHYHIRRKKSSAADFMRSDARGPLRPASSTRKTQPLPSRHKRHASQPPCKLETAGTTQPHHSLLAPSRLYHSPPHMPSPPRTAQPASAPRNCSKSPGPASLPTQALRLLAAPTP